MKTMNYSIIRCICALVLGVLLVAWPEAAILYLVITIGALFLVPGLFSVFGYLTRGKQNGMSFPIAGLGSLLFGLWLMIMPAFFVGILMYVLGAVLVLAGISQIVNLSAARSWTVVPGGFFVVPVLVLIVKYVEQKLTKSFLQKNGYASETDYRKKIKEQLIRQKEQSVEQEEYDKFIDRMRKNCKITLNEKETAAFALSNYVNNVQQTAILNKQDFAEYVKETYQMSKDDYYQSVYQQSEQDITKVILEGILSVSVGEDGREYAENVYAIKKHYLHIQYEEYI